MKPRALERIFLATLAAAIIALTASAQSTAPDEAKAAYLALTAFTLDGGIANVSDLVLKRDRVEMVFSGTFYFPKPVLGKITGAVFLGQGKLRAEPPPNSFEKDNLQRMLKADVVESGFETAVLRFTDDTYVSIGKSQEPGGEAPKNAQQLATEIQARTIKETGINIASRLLLSMLNNENPGVFIAQFYDARRGRFTLALDLQCRIPTVNFSINGGEKGLIFRYNNHLYTNDVWLAFYSEQDYKTGRVYYSDSFDQVDVDHYALKADLREPRKRIRVNAKADITTLGSVRAISFAISEGLGQQDSMGKKKAMRITAARLGDGTPLMTIQEEWEGGFLVLLPSLTGSQQRLVVEMDVEGDFIYDKSDTSDCHYPFINGQWYPRHGYLKRSTFEISFLHNKKYKVAGPGERVSEEPVPGTDNDVLTVYRMNEPVALVTFAMGPYKIYKEQRKLAKKGLDIEFFSHPGGVDIEGRHLTIKEDFVLAEMGNALDFLSAMFGEYPYPVFRSAFHPFGFGQGFATFLAIPNADSANSSTFMFLSHETAHQWWGNIVSWRSYRDQWLSEGFAEYSGMLYMRERTQNAGKLREAVEELRQSLREPPSTETGIGANRVTDIGPIILGHRLGSSQSQNAYSLLTYSKGALVLRMLHFLFTDPNSGDGKAFFDMMKGFVDRFRNSSASTEEFASFASEHFIRTPLAQKYQIPNLKWFFMQYVWQTALPSYRLEYTIQDQPGGKVLVQGTIFQENAPEDWVALLPVTIKFGGNRTAHGTILAAGPQRPVAISLPEKPSSVELDPDHWVLSEKTSEKKR